jgi:regulatory protein
VTIVSLKAEKPGLMRVEFSDGTSLLATINYLPDGMVSKGIGELSAAEEDAFRFAAACYRAEKAAMRLIARAEQHSLGLTAKLERRGFEAAVANAVVSRFLDQDLLDDGRYAELWIRPRLSYRKTPSPRWLLSSLRKRGIDRATAGKALEKALDPETEYALLLSYLEKARLPQGEKARFLRAHLKNEGFSYSALERFFGENTK